MSSNLSAAPSRADEFGTQPEITIDGDRIGSQYEIITTIVDQDLLRPDSCSVVIADRDRHFLAETGTEIGQELIVKATPVKGSESRQIFAGTIHALEVTSYDGHHRVLITAYDRSYALIQARFSTATATDETTAADFIRTICGDLNIDLGTVELEDVKFEHLSIFDETPWSYISRQAAHSGCFIRYIDGKLHLLKPANTSVAPALPEGHSTDPRQLVVGDNIIVVSARATAAGQASVLEIRGWDPDTGKVLTAEAEPNDTAAEAPASDPAGAAASAGTPRRIVPRPSVSDQAQVDLLADTIAAKRGMGHMTVDAVARGHPALIAGETVSIAGIDTFSGAYLITKAIHRMEPQRYTTELSCSGLQDQSLQGMLQPQAPRRLDGIFTGVVTKMDDPKSAGRVKVGLPWLSDNYETGWARVGSIGAGNGSGLMWLPATDDEVLVSFVDGDPDSPVVLGGLFSGVRPAPFTGDADAETSTRPVRGIKTPAGLSISLIDKSGEEEVVISTGDDQIKVVLDQRAGKLALTASNSLELTCTNGPITVKGSGIELTSTDRSIGIDGKSVDIKGEPINLN